MVSVIVMGCCQRNSCPFGNPFIILGISRIRTTDLDTNAQNVTNGNFEQDVRVSLETHLPLYVRVTQNLKYLFGNLLDRY